MLSSHATQMVEVETRVFSVGDCFDSFCAVEEKIRQYESIKFVKFWKREARTIEAARKRITRDLNLDLKYYEPSLTLTTSKSKSGRKLSQNDKYSKALVLTTQLASTASEASHFHRCLKLLKELADCWRNVEEVGLSIDSILSMVYQQLMIFLMWMN